MTLIRKERAKAHVNLFEDVDGLFYGITDHTLFLTSPDYSPESHENLIRRTYRAVRINIDYVQDRSFFRPELVSWGKREETLFLNPCSSGCSTWAEKRRKNYNKKRQELGT